MTTPPTNGGVKALAHVNRTNAAMLCALHQLKRCPGIDQTDQKTGETFRDILNAAIRRAGSEP